MGVVIIRICSGDEVIEAQLLMGVVVAGGTMKERKKQKSRKK